MTTLPGVLARRRRSTIAVAGVVLLAVLTLLVIGLRHRDPARVIESPVSRVHRHDVFGTVTAAAAEIVTPTGHARWVGPGGRPTTPPRAADKPAGAVRLDGVDITPSGHQLLVTVAAPAGTIELGAIARRSLSPASYAFLPQLSLSPDDHAVSVVVGRDDPLAVGQADALLLRAGRAPLTIPVTLDDAGQAPTPCTPRSGSEPRWGWVTATVGSKLDQGRAVFVAATGGRRTATTRVGRPYGGCAVTPAGYVLTYDNSDSGGVVSGAAWLDARGAVLRRARAASADPSLGLTVAADGSVLLPGRHGFEQIGADGTRRELTAVDARFDADGGLWILRHGLATREAP